jgi:hypothetical protein
MSDDELDIELLMWDIHRRILVTGAKALIRSMEDWFGLCPFAGVRPAE